MDLLVENSFAKSSQVRAIPTRLMYNKILRFSAMKPVKMAIDDLGDITAYEDCSMLNRGTVMRF